MKEDDLIEAADNKLDYTISCCPVCGAAIDKPCFHTKKYTPEFLKDLSGEIHLGRLRRITCL